MSETNKSSELMSKRCGVCGDRAIAKNFGAVSCESCKAFFRRNAAKLNVYKCYFDNKCKIDSVTRKFCRGCRLRLCFEIGMKQEWILNEEEKQVRKMKIEEKRRRKNSVQSSKRSSDSMSSSSPEVSNNSTEINEINENSITDEDIITNLVEIENFITSDEINEISDDVYQKAVELEFSVLPIARPLPENESSFNEIEMNRLTELFNALNVMQNQNTKNISEVNNVDNMCGVMAAKLDKDIRSLVSVSKNLSAFNTMCDNDQISLLKYGSVEIFCMRSVLVFNFQTNYMTLDLDNNNTILVKMDLFKEDANEIYRAHTNYLKKIGSEWDSDSVILDLLTAIVLFNPDRPNLIHKNMVKLQQQMYMYLLQRYLQLRYQSECKSKEKFLRLLNILNDLDVLNKLHRDKGCQRNESSPEQFGPLVREILDIE